VIITHKIRSL